MKNVSAPLGTSKGDKRVNRSQLHHKSWISTLPLNKVMEVVSDTGKVLVDFSLINYKIENGTVKLEVSLKNGAVWAEVGMAELKLCPEVTLRVHSPVELHAVGGSGLSPKMVYHLPKGYLIRRAQLAKVESIYDRARVHNFEVTPRV